VLLHMRPKSRPMKLEGGNAHYKLCKYVTIVYEACRISEVRILRCGDLVTEMIPICAELIILEGQPRTAFTC